MHFMAGSARRQCVHSAEVIVTALTRSVTLAIRHLIHFYCVAGSARRQCVLGAEVIVTAHISIGMLAPGGERNMLDFFGASEYNFVI